MAARDTGGAYRRYRAALLASEPLCRYCAAKGLVVLADVLDHVLALSLGGANEVTNYAPACVPCNALKAKVEQRLARKGYRGADARLDPELALWLALAAMVTPNR